MTASPHDKPAELVAGDVANEQGAWEGTFSSPSEMDAYFGRETIHCLICWRDGFRALGDHLSQAHGLTVHEYRDRYRIPKSRGLICRPARDERSTAMKVATRPPNWRGRPFSPLCAFVDWEGFLRRVAAGERIYRLHGQPGMPTSGQLGWRRRKDEAFDAACVAAAAGRQGAKPPPGRLAEIEAQLKAGVPASRLRDDDSQVRTRYWLARQRRSDPALSERLSPLIRTPRKPSDIDWDGFARRVDAGEPIVRVASTEAAMPSLGMWHRERLRNPDLARRITESITSRRRVVVRQVPQPVSAALSLEAYNRRLRSDDLYAMVEAAVPKYLLPDMRNDIVSEVIVSLLDGEIGVADIAKAVRTQIAAYNRMFARRDLSFDDEVGGTGPRFSGLLADPSAFDLSSMNTSIIQPAVW